MKYEYILHVKPDALKGVRKLLWERYRITLIRTSLKALDGSVQCIFFTDLDSCDPKTYDKFYKLVRNYKGVTSLYQSQKVSSVLPTTYRLVYKGINNGIKCLVCGMTSYHSMDVQERYCSGCGQWHQDLAQMVVNGELKLKCSE